MLMARKRGLFEIRTMADQETQRYIDWVRKGLKQPGKTQKGLAEHLGIAHPQITSLLKGTRQVKVSEIPAMAAYLDMPPPARRFPLLGDVGAGGVVVETEWPGEPEMVDGPEDAPVGTVAVNIMGDSLGPNFEGWRAFYANRKDPFDDRWIGHLCVVGTADGRVLIKWVRLGSHGFNLISGTGHIEENVSLMWAAKVIDIKPRL